MTPPGWYPDPTGQVRYWDGANWGHLAPQATVVPVRTNHAVHILMTLLTCGIWLPVWIIVAAANSNKTRKVY